MDELNKMTAEIGKASSVEEYYEAVDALIRYFVNQEKRKEADYIRKFRQISRNRFSSREENSMLEKKKEELLRYCADLNVTEVRNMSEEKLIRRILENFCFFCKKLYLSDIHKHCSNGVKEHLQKFRIENEYDLQKLMLSALNCVFSDARVEIVQDSGHHSVRKDIVIDSCDAAIELKCTRATMTERELSEQVASDIIHYDCRNLYFYIYDKAGIIQNPVSFQKTYEDKSAEYKRINVIIYAHDDV